MLRIVGFFFITTFLNFSVSLNECLLILFFSEMSLFISHEMYYFYNEKDELLFWKLLCVQTWIMNHQNTQININVAIILMIFS